MRIRVALFLATFVASLYALPGMDAQTVAPPPHTELVEEPQPLVLETPDATVAVAPAPEQALGIYGLINDK